MSGEFEIQYFIAPGQFNFIDINLYILKILEMLDKMTYKWEVEDMDTFQVAN